MERTSRETWVKRIERWKDSGLTSKEFAAELGISPDALTWWKWHLGRQAKMQEQGTGEAERPASRRAAARRRATRRKPTASKPATAPVTFVELTPPVPSEPLEVVLRSDIRIRVRQNFDAATLAQLLDVLEKRG